MGYSPHDVHVDDRPKRSLNGQQNTGFAVKRDFWPLLKLAGLRRIRFRDLRQTFAASLSNGQLFSPHEHL
jgi:hypothetical protein